MPQLVGLSSSQTIPAGALLRLTFGTPGWDPLNYFASHMTATWNVLPVKAHLYPSTGPSVYPGATTATIDARTQSARTASDIVAAVAGLDDNFCELQTVTLLSAVEVVNANTPAGATARDAASSAAAAKQTADSWWTKLTNGLSIGADTLKWVAIAVVLVVLLVAYHKAER